MDRIKALAKEHLSDNQIRVLRRWLHVWRRRRDDTGPLPYTLMDLRHASRKMWAGHSATAADVLARILETAAAPKSHRARAEFQLAKLYATNQDWGKINGLLTDAILPYLDSGDRSRGRLLKAVAAMESGQCEVAQRCLADSATTKIGKYHNWLLHSNLEYYRAYFAGDAADEGLEERRLAYVNKMYRDAGLIEICRKDSACPLDLGNITASSVRLYSRSCQAKVSILVPCYNAESTIGFALESILAQTYHNIEIVCVDDNSADDTASIVRSYAEDGAPVKLLRNGQNSGPYYSRNRALKEACGDFVTVHDADDWMHPQRIEVQLTHLRAESRVKFSFTRLARVSNGFLFTLRPFRPMLEPIHWSYTSILGRRESFLALGGWDPVMAHADAEFIDRIKDELGEKALGECLKDVPMALFWEGDGNLTKRSDTVLTSVGFGARREYQEQAREWRRAGAPGLPKNRMIERNNGREPFFVPNALLPEYLKRTGRYDFVFFTDMSLLGGTRRCNLEYFGICAEHGWKVGVFNYPRYRGRRAGSIDKEYRRLFDQGLVDLLTPEDTVEASALIVHHPPILTAPIDRYPTVNTSNVALLVNQLPYQSTYADSPALYEPREVEADLERAFGCAPVWIPISGLVRSTLTPLLRGSRMIDDTWYPVVGGIYHADDQKAKDGSICGRPIRLGRHSRDDATKWPATASELRKVFPSADDIEVHILGGADNMCDQKVPAPADWTVHAFDSIDVRSFLAGIDVFIHWTRDDYIEEFGRNVAEAMAFGVPCILSRHLKPTFGDAALYPEAADVEKTLRELAADTQLRQDLVAKGRDFVNENCRASVAGERMKRLLVRRNPIEAANDKVVASERVG